jgi:Na+/pantothenate symporter
VIDGGLSPILAQSGSNAALVTFLLYTLAVFGLAAFSNRLLQKKSFISEYFLGSRSLGVWAFALTFAATSASGGSFTGFPSKIYTHGWILGLWIGSYIVVPICAMGLMGKRINQVARISGAITVPDVLRDRFRSASFGLIAVALIVFFMSFNLVGQFKAGSKILIVLLEDVGVFKETVAWLANVKMNIGFLQNVEADYLLCLVTFAAAVVIYTTYGGFHAVVWTDVLQGLVMVVGVILMLPLAIYLVGGLPNATRKMAEMTTPRVGLVRIDVGIPLADNHAIVSRWFTLPGESGQRPRLFRLNTTLTILKGQSTVEDQKFVEITTPAEIDEQLQRLTRDSETAIQQGLVGALNDEVRGLKEKQIAWLKSSIADDTPNDIPANAQRTINRLQSEIEHLDDNDMALLTADGLNAVTPTITVIREYEYGAGRKGMYVSGPGPPKPPQLPKTAKDYKPATADKDKKIDGFLPLSIAISFFFMWAISGAGQPSSMVRLMAFNSSQTLRRAIFTVAIYYTLIYFPLVIIFCCARILLPGMDLDSDRIMPQMAVMLTTNIGQGWLAGLLIAAPFAAVMSTVDSFLLMISSGLVRDIYQRNINPEVGEKTIKRLSFLFTFLVGTGAMLGALNPPQFLQDIIVYTGSGLAACFLGPMIFALYWPRANVEGCISGMLAGFSAHLAMYVAGMFVNGSFFQPYQLFNFNPIIIGLLVSFVACYAVTKLTPPPPEDLVRKYFYKKQ